MKLKNMVLSDTSLLPFRIISLKKEIFKLGFKEQNVSELSKESLGEGAAHARPRTEENMFCSRNENVVCLEK